MRSKEWLLAAGLVLALPGAASADEGPQSVEPVVVTASRISTPLSRTNRSAVVVGREEIARSPARSLAELLQNVAGVDVRTRGPAGVQADVSIRGASFEETLLLVDGVRVSDPQTGHHLLDVPINLDDIERIEIIKGQGSSLYGPNAFGGVVNIITRRAAGRSARLSLAAGEHRLLEARASGAAPTGPLAHRLSLERRTSEGWRHNTDFDITTLSWSGAFGTDALSPVLSAGWTRKEFGANGFYSDRYPEQRETTEGLLLQGKAGFGGAAWSLIPSLLWRQHKDDYILDATVVGPSRYENRHTTDVYGGQLEYTLQTALGTTAIGLEGGRERIGSNRLGEHERGRVGLSAEQLLTLGDRFNARVGASAWNYEDAGWRFFPGADFGLRLGAGATWFGSVERAFRVPTYTELFYTSPVNQGNPDLAPEAAWNWESGLKGGRGEWRWEASVFRRVGTDLIDWTREHPEDPWKARNIARVVTDGVEAGVGWAAASTGDPIQGVRLDYTYLDSDKSLDAGESRYVLDHLRHQAVVHIDHRLPFALRQRWFLRYEERLNGDTDFFADTQIERSWRDVTLALEARNLFNASSAPIGGVPQPGRWVLLRLSWNFSLLHPGCAGEAHPR